MLKLFKPKNHSMVGIDISSYSIKVLEITHVDDKFQIKGYGCERLPAKAFEGNTVKNIDAVAACLKRALLKAKITSKIAVLAVPDAAVISKIVQINKGLTESEIEALIFIETDNHFPYPIDEISVDFEVMGPSVNNPAMLDVLVVASRTVIVNSLVEVVNRAGLEAKIVDVESYAVERVAQLLTRDLPADGQDNLVAVIDIGAIFTHLLVLQGMKIIFNREEEFGSKQLINEIASHYGLCFEEATVMKTEGKLPEDYESAVLQPYMEMILLQIKRALQFFYSTSLHGSVDHIILAGSMDLLPNLAELVREKTGIATCIANPFQGMSFAKHLNHEQMKYEGPSLMVACGLALRKSG